MKNILASLHNCYCTD